MGSRCTTHCRHIHPFHLWKREEIERLGTICPLVTAAEILGISKWTAYDQAQDGTFPVKVVRTGRKWGVVVESLLDFLYDDNDNANAEESK